MRVEENQTPNIDIKKTVFGISGAYIIPTNISGKLGRNIILRNIDTKIYKIIAQVPKERKIVRSLFGSSISGCISMYMPKMTTAMSQSMSMIFLVFFIMDLSLWESCFLSKKDIISHMQISGISSNLWKYFLIQFTNRRNFIPILSVYYLTLTNTHANEIGLYTGIGYIAALLMQIPSGYIADHY